MSGDTFDGPWGMHIHDARDLKSYLADRVADTDGFVDAIVTSPPYADVEDYGDQDDQVGQQGYEGFLSDITDIFRQCYEIAADDATLWIITDTFRRSNRLIRLPFDLADELENLPELEVCRTEGCDTTLHRDRETGEYRCPKCESVYDPLTESWRLMDNIIWDKKRTRSWYSRGQLRNVHEHISVYIKSDEYTYNLDDVRITDTDEFARWWVDYPERYSPKGMAPENIWEYEIPKQGQWGPKTSYHPSPFPVDLVERIVRLATDEGDVVLDPFAGVGTTLAVAEGLDRKPLGFELNDEFKTKYEEYVLPEISQHLWFSTDQTTRQEHLRWTIWSLRIQKYALEVYKQLIHREATPHNPGDFYYILVRADRAELETTDKNPAATIWYVLDDMSDPGELPIKTAREELISDEPQSGDYYEVDFTFDATTISDYQARLEDGNGLFTEEDTIALYLGGNHHERAFELPFSEWHETVGEAVKYEYREENWVPMVSNQSLDQANPIDSTVASDTGSQSTLGSYRTDTDDE
jgi:DNA modification methylase